MAVGWFWGVGLLGWFVVEVVGCWVVVGGVWVVVGWWLLGWLVVGVGRWLFALNGWLGGCCGGFLVGWVVVGVVFWLVGWLLGG